MVIVTHVLPHLDEIGAFWLLQKFGEKKYPGINKAPLLFADIEGQAIRLGVGGGEFDEHSTNDKNRKEGECSFTLVLKALGLGGEPALKKIAKFILQVDTKGGTHPFDISTLVKEMYAQKSPEEVIDWAIKALEAKYNDQVDFFKAGDDFKRGKITELKVGEKKLNLVIMESDSTKAASFARSEFGCKAAVVIQKNSSGNVQIFIDKKIRLNTPELVKAVRLMEQIKKDQLLVSNWEDLVLEGIIEEVREWFYHQEGEMLLNGSITSPEVPPTSISLEELEEITIAALSGDNLPHFCETKGRCTSKCRWYPFTLFYCRQRQ